MLSINSSKVKNIYFTVNRTEHPHIGEGTTTNYDNVLKNIH